MLFLAVTTQTPAVLCLGIPAQTLLLVVECTYTAAHKSSVLIDTDVKYEIIFM